MRTLAGWPIALASFASSSSASVPSSGRVLSGGSDCSGGQHRSSSFASGFIAYRRLAIAHWPAHVKGKRVRSGRSDIRMHKLFAHIKQPATSRGSNCACHAVSIVQLSLRLEALSKPHESGGGGKIVLFGEFHHLRIDPVQVRLHNRSLVPSSLSGQNNCRFQQRGRAPIRIASALSILRSSASNPGSPFEYCNDCGRVENQLRRLRDQTPESLLLRPGSTACRAFRRERKREISL